MSVRNKYIGTFLNKKTDTIKKGETIEVSIIPNLSDGETLGDTIELSFPFEDPVVITQESDGIFTPLKTQGATISIFTEEIFWDLYSKKPFDWYVKIENTSRDIMLFEGYLTPCAYTQDYAFNGVLQLEAIDFLAASENVPYSVANGTNRGIVTISNLLINFLNTIPNKGTLSYDIEELRYDTTVAEFVNLKLQEANFFDDDDEETPWKWKEVMEEICKLLGFSLMYYNNKLVFQDYNSGASSKITLETLDSERYSDGTPTVELDEVYNNIRVNCSLYEVEDLAYDMFDEDHISELQNLTALKELGQYSQYWWQWRKHSEHTKPEHKFWSFIKPYSFKADNYRTSLTEKIAGWTSFKTLLGDSANKEIKLPTAEEIEEGTFLEHLNANEFMYYDPSSKRTTFIPFYATCYPIRQFTYNMAEGMNTDTITWTNLLAFTLARSSEQQVFTSLYTDSVTGDKFYRFAKRDIPALTYYNPHCIAYSTPVTPYDDSNTKYIVIDADVFWSTTNGIEGVDDDYGNIDMPVTADVSSEVTYRVLKPVCTDKFDIQNFDADDTSVCHKVKDGALANRGFPMFKATLRIGDKYWDGRNNIWSTDSSSFFYMYFHEDDVCVNSSFENDDVVDFFTIWKWNKIAANPAVRNYDSNTDAYAIPVKASDRLNGDFEFTINCPVGLPVGWQNGDDGKTIRQPNILWMRNLSIEYKSNPYRWDEDSQEDKDIFYENDENISDYALEFSDIECKINSYYPRKPASKSYILSGSDNLPLWCSLSTSPMLGRWTPETRLVEKYYNHYSTPKKIFNVNYHIGDLNPNKRFKHTGMNTEFVLDSWEFNVKNDTTNLKLIEL